MKEITALGQSHHPMDLPVSPLLMHPPPLPEFSPETPHRFTMITCPVPLYSLNIAVRLIIVLAFF